jgi:hypothetical protein
MNRKGIYDYYSQPEVQQALLKISRKREVVGVFGDGSFATRPSTLVYPKDIMQLVRNGVVSFHGSLERWSNPMAVGSENYERGRTGWDLILDLDCSDTEHGKTAALVFIDALQKHGVEHVSVKFTGGTGFHLGVPFESMPAEVDYSRTCEQYPDLARKMVGYLRHFARERLEKALLGRWSIEELAARSGKQVGEIMDEDGIDPFRIVEVDPVLISPRHLFRLPYALHESKHLVSLPLSKNGIEGFRPEHAQPENLQVGEGFLDSYKEDEASLLVVEAVDWHAKQKRAAESRPAPELRLRDPVPLKFAPPCIDNILKGLPDGRKRSIFILINYLSSLKWGWDEIEEQLVKWNQKNRPPLGESYLRGQIRWHRNRKKAVPPPNCSNAGYYENFGVCQPDDVCGGAKKSVKNPINHALRLLKKEKRGPSRPRGRRSGKS